MRASEPWLFRCVISIQGVILHLSLLVLVRPHFSRHYIATRHLFYKTWSQQVIWHLCVCSYARITSDTGKQSSTHLLMCSSSCAVKVLQKTNTTLFMLVCRKPSGHAQRPKRAVFLDGLLSSSTGNVPHGFIRWGVKQQTGLALSRIYRHTAGRSTARDKSMLFGTHRRVFKQFKS